MSNIGTKFILAQRFVFDPNSNSLIDQTNDSEIVRLGSNESRILLMLSERPNEVITRNELHEYVWRDQGFEVDDSSLTQAVSTLRKMLKDSTKSPEFVKTVPKRGYQFIASVERSAPLSSNDQTQVAVETSEPFESVDDVQPTSEQEPTVEVTQSESTEPEATKPSVTAQTETSDLKTNKWTPRLVILAALLLPLLVLAFTNPAESKFRTLSEVDGVQILSPVSHPSLDSWLNSIETCVAQYNEDHPNERKPDQVIATGGQNNQVVLNYIHNQEHASENVTLRIFTEQSDLSSICKGDN
ncbi:transcriptional regulator [Vibrio sp. T187]|uniref:winged helix-turn-helix domain-containing protein n=1 Tax=Vibrio TaxID=662 RepID=UPI0010C9FDB3|nr:MULTISPECIES: transcriptional regulator [Vibrio]MBW3694434.1 transcriptional regulator [Vibrio sp. T187]